MVFFMHSIAFTVVPDTVHIMKSKFYNSYSVILGMANIVKKTLNREIFLTNKTLKLCNKFHYLQSIISYV